MIGAEILLWMYEVEGFDGDRQRGYHAWDADSHGWRHMLHSWLGWLLARLGCALSAWGNALQERYYRYLPERDTDQYLEEQLAQVMRDTEKTGWSVLPE